MFGKRKRIRSNGVADSLIGGQTEIRGDLSFSGDLVILGTVHGNVIAEDGSTSILNLSESGRVEGEIRVPNVAVNGVVVGDVYATERVQLARNARVNGNVYYHLIEMEMGAEVNGNLVHIDEQLDVRLTLGHEPPAVGALPGRQPDETIALDEPGDSEEDPKSKLG